MRYGAVRCGTVRYGTVYVKNSEIRILHRVFGKIKHSLNKRLLQNYIVETCEINWIADFFKTKANSTILCISLVFLLKPMLLFLQQQKKNIIAIRERENSRKTIRSYSQLAIHIACEIERNNIAFNMKVFKHTQCVCVLLCLLNLF